MYAVCEMLNELGMTLGLYFSSAQVPTHGAGKCEHPDLLRNTDEICRPLETPLYCTHRSYPDVPNSYSLDTPLICLTGTCGHMLDGMLFEWRDGLRI